MALNSQYLFCEWREKLIVVNRGSGKVTLKTLIRAGSGYSLETRHDDSQFKKFEKFLATRCILDAFTGYRTSFLLAARSLRSALQLEMLVMGDTSGTFEECGLQFEISCSKFPEDDSSYQLLDGPTVCWSKGPHVYVAHGSNLEQTSINVQRVAAHLKVDKIRRLWCFSHSDSKGTCSSLLLFAQLSLREPRHPGEFGRCEWVTVEVDLRACLSFVAVETEPKATLVQPDPIPCDYGYIATCITSHRTLHLDRTSGALLEKMSFLVGTEYEQVIHVQDGTLLHVVSLQCVPHQITVIQVKMSNWTSCEKEKVSSF